MQFICVWLSPPLDCLCFDSPRVPLVWVRPAGSVLAPPTCTSTRDPRTIGYIGFPCPAGSPWSVVTMPSPRTCSSSATLRSSTPSATAGSSFPSASPLSSLTPTPPLLSGTLVPPQGVVCADPLRALKPSPSTLSPSVIPMALSRRSPPWLYPGWTLGFHLVPPTICSKQVSPVNTSPVFLSSPRLPPVHPPSIGLVRDCDFSGGGGIVTVLFCLS